jgi:hypothetical protein
LPQETRYREDDSVLIRRYAKSSIYSTKPVYGWIHSDDYPEVNALKEEIRVALSGGGAFQQPALKTTRYQLQVRGKYLS